MTPLQESIEVWRGHLAKAREGELLRSRLGTDNCPLCKVHLTVDDPCGGCPVRVYTGRRSCLGTPYYSVLDALALGIDREDRSSRVVEACEAELSFLEGLRHDQK